jgi:hypothetical protein
VFSYLDLPLEALLLINKCAKQASSGGTKHGKEDLEEGKEARSDEVPDHDSLVIVSRFLHEISELFNGKKHGKEAFEESKKARANEALDQKRLGIAI